ncbi:MAG: formylglycine-generating enzyme family protein [Treponema sp.]|nr:formylglycine-generating enzyme family protein [Treponema sp.]
MKKYAFFVIILVFITAITFAYSAKQKEVYVKGAVINMQEYVKFCDSTTEIKDLYVQKYEVTRAEFEEYLDFYGYNKLKEYSKDGGLFTYNGIMPYPECAAVLVTFYDACKYCNWRSQKEGLTPAYEIEDELPFAIKYFEWKQENGKWTYYVPKMPEIKLNEKANGYRLPTINEYFYLLLGGAKGIKEKWWEGIDITKYEAFKVNSTAVAKVGSLKANPLGIYDLFSNAPEWIWADTKIFDRDDNINYAKYAIGFSPKNVDLTSFDILLYFSNKTKLSSISPIHRGFIGMRMVRNAK